MNSKMHSVIPFLLALLLLLGGCAVQQEERTTELLSEIQWPSSDAQVHTRRDYSLSAAVDAYTQEFPGISITHARMDDTPIYEVYRTDGKNMPLLFFLHEQGNRKDEFLEVAATYAQSGYFCVLMDLPGYGERTSNETIQAVESIVTSSAEIDLLLEYYRFSPLADSGKFALWGVSMGGSAAYHYAAYGQHTPALLLICSAEADLTRLTDTGSITSGQEQAPTWSSQELLQYCETNNPLNQLDHLGTIPAFIVHGCKDTIILVDSIRELEGILSPYGCARFLFLEEAGHDTVPSMLSYASAMLNQYLR